MAVKPEYVMQSDTQRCWAACMESWSAAAYYMARVPQGELVRRYAANASGGLDTNSDKYREFLLTFSLRAWVAPGGGLDEKLVERWLDVTGFFIVIMQTGAQSSHAMLAYDYFEKQLLVMDPARGYKTGLLDGLGYSLCLHMVL